MPVGLVAGSARRVGGPDPQAPWYPAGGASIALAWQQLEVASSATAALRATAARMVTRNAAVLAALRRRSSGSYTVTSLRRGLGQL